MSYLLDTNIVSRLAREPQGPIAAALRVAGEDRVATSIIVAAELRFGVSKGASARLGERIEAILSRLVVHAFDEPADRRYGELRAHPERRGENIGGTDLLIAAHALALGATVVTDNAEDFRRVPELVVENRLQTE